MKRLLFFMLLLSSISLLHAQDRIVKGVVTDENNSPVPGATVFVKGTSVGTATNINGEYTLKLPATATSFTVSFIGYNPTELKYTGKPVMNAKLTPSAVALKEVVAVGYGVQKKATMTGSVVSVSSKDLLKTPVANMAAAMIGRTPGLTTYQKSGQPGADGITLRIRGIETTNGQDPLILVDGVERDFTQLDPNEIESISVLKDAASTAVFGVRGANGVMIVTTKKGEEGPAKVSITSNLSIQQPTRLPKMIDAATFCKMYNEALKNDNPTNYVPRFDEATIQKYVDGTNPMLFPNNDWFKIALKPQALQQQHNINISGGTKTTKYYTSVGYFSQGGLMNSYQGQLNRQLDNNYNYDRYNLRSNIDVDVTPTTKVGVMISGIISKANDPGFNFGTLISTTPISYPIVYEDRILQSSVNFAGTPLMSMVGTSMTEKNANTMALTVNFNQKLDFITKGLLFRGIASYDSYYSHNTTRSQGYILYNIDKPYIDEDGTEKYGVPTGENYLVTDPSEAWSRKRTIHAEAAIEYKNSFGKHNFAGLLLTTLDKKWYTASSYNWIPVTYDGVVTRFTYDYNSKYMLEFNMGYNGSENFPENKRFAWFPAFSAGWNVGEESFIKSNISRDILDKLKIRVSHGVVGNDQTSANRFLYLDSEYKTSEYKSGGGAVFGDATSKAYAGLVAGKLGNKSITWETATKENFGIEVSMFKNKLTFNADYFTSDRKNILTLLKSTPAHISILDADYFNLGHVKNHGYEFEGKWRQEIGKFSYYIGGNYSFARNKIIYMDEVLDYANPNRWRTGTRLNENFGLIANGFFNTTDELARGPVYGTPGLGDARYVDINGDGVVDSKDEMPIGNPEFPEINYGINMGFGYKGFDVSVLFQGASNTTKMMSGKFQKPFDVNGGMMEFAVAERWAPDNIENAVRPRLTLNYANPSSYVNSTMWLRDGSFLKLRNVEVSYRFNSKMIKNLIGLAGLRIYANGQNLFTWDKLKVVDPEASTSDSWTYPQLRVYNVGVKVDF